VRAATLHPYDGPHAAGTDRSTLTGKVMCGYQGWFTAAGDGADFGWHHWTTDRREPREENVRVDLWPDVSELAAGDRFPTALRRADGHPAEVFSSFRSDTVLRHFRWMREYGIDGAFVQRFPTGLGDTRLLRINNTVLSHCRDAAHREGRAWALMYDLTGLGAGRIAEVIADWRALHDRMRLPEDAAYLHHRGKPLVAVWGAGFSDQRAYSLADCRALVEVLKADGCSVMLGVPAYWRELRGDAAPAPALHDLIRIADVLSPWTVGRYADDDGVRRHAEKLIAPDLAWCRDAGLDYLPVVFPGFSWHNMRRTAAAPFDAIPRRGGRFLWSQCLAAKRAGATALYVAMFDEVDEGTAIFKCTAEPPDTGAVRFLAEPGLAPDHYLRLTGEAGRMIRGEIPASGELPNR